MDRRAFLAAGIGASLAKAVHAEGIPERSPFGVVLVSVIGTPKSNSGVRVPGFSLILPTEAPGDSGPYDVTAYLQYTQDDGTTWKPVPAKDGDYKAGSTGGVVEYVKVDGNRAVVNLFFPHEVMDLAEGKYTLRFQVVFYDKVDNRVPELNKDVGRFDVEVTKEDGVWERRVYAGGKSASFMKIYNLETGEPVKDVS